MLFSHLCRSQQEWFSEIKIWRESLVKYGDNPFEKPVGSDRIEFSSPDTVNPGKANGTNEEKSAKRKPIVFDLERDYGRAADNVLETSIPVDPILAKHRRNKFNIDDIEELDMMEEVFDVEDDPGLHQDDDDLIILDQTEDDVVIVDAHEGGDLRLSLSNKKPSNNFISRRVYVNSGDPNTVTI